MRLDPTSLDVTGHKLTGDLPDYQGAEDSIAQDEEGSYPLRVPWIGQHVAYKGCPCHCGAEVARRIDAEDQGGPTSRFECLEKYDGEAHRPTYSSVVIVCFYCKN